MQTKLCYAYKEGIFHSTLKIICLQPPQWAYHNTAWLKIWWWNGTLSSVLPNEACPICFGHNATCEPVCVKHMLLRHCFCPTVPTKSHLSVDCMHMHIIQMYTGLFSSLCCTYVGWVVCGYSFEAVELCTDKTLMEYSFVSTRCSRAKLVVSVHMHSHHDSTHFLTTCCFCRAH